LASAIAIGVSLNVAYSGGSSNDLVSEYIVQGAKKETILKNIDTVGGIVVHEYSVIEAISVKLSKGQLSELKKINPLLRSFKDKGVKVASAIQSFSSDNMKF
jgi:serine protease AprX